MVNFSQIIESWGFTFTPEASEVRVKDLCDFKGCSPPEGLSMKEYADRDNSSHRCGYALSSRHHFWVLSRLAEGIESFRSHPTTALSESDGIWPPALDAYLTPHDGGSNARAHQQQRLREVREMWATKVHSGLFSYYPAVLPADPFSNAEPRSYFLVPGAATSGLPNLALDLAWGHVGEGIHVAPTKLLIAEPSERPPLLRGLHWSVNIKSSVSVDPTDDASVREVIATLTGSLGLPAAVKAARAV